MMTFAQPPLNLPNLSQPSSEAASPSSPTANFNNQSKLAGVSSLSGPSLEAPQGMSYVEFVRSWDDQHVARWLAEHKCLVHTSLFRSNDIRGDVILELDQPTLKEMGIGSMGDRIRIINAVKTLRQKCSTRPTPSPRVQSLGLKTPLTNSFNAIAQMPNDPSPTNPNDDISPSSRQRGRPAPLQLRGAQQADLPRLVRDSPSSTLDSSRSTGSGRPLPHQPPPVSGSSSTPSTGGSLPSGGSHHSANGGPTTRANLPPVPPPPRTQPPLPPTNGRPPRIYAHTQVPGRRTPTPSETNHYANQALPPAPQHSSLAAPSANPPNVIWKGGNDYGSSGPRPGIVVPNNRSVSPLPPSQTRSSPVGTHSKTNSFSGLGSSVLKAGQRGSPGGSNGLTPPSNALHNNLSPIIESFGGPPQISISTPGTGNSGSSSASAYSVGRGPFIRPTTPLHTSGPSLDDLRRKLIKIHKDSSFTVFNVADCKNGEEVLLKALKKFRLGAVESDDEVDYEGADEGALNVEGWGIFWVWGDDGGMGKPLTESQLLAVCHAGPDHPAREQGLTLRRIGKPKVTRLQQLSTEPFPQLEMPTSPTSPVSNNNTPQHENKPDNGLLSVQTDFDEARDFKRTKRASSISVLSALGVPDPQRVLDPVPPSPNTATSLDSAGGSAKSPNSTSIATKIQKFLGRPPSEYVSYHLQEYFPDTDKKVLRKTARQSMLRNFGQFGKSVLHAPQARFSTSTQTSRLSSSPSKRTSYISIPASQDGSEKDSPEATPVDSTFGGRRSVMTDEFTLIDNPSDEDKPSTDHLLPPVVFPSESLSDSVDAAGARFGASPPMSRTQSSASKRMSYMSELRRKRDKSDTASMLTVDEITAEVENRRRSVAIEGLKMGSVASLDILGDPESRRVSVALSIPQVEEELEEDEDEMDDEEDEEEEEDEDEMTVAVDEDDEPGKAVTSAGGKRAIKWIRGALIGAGSFGSVYLGMDAMTGLLMAVKQVEMPTGSGPNEERKMSMLTALEREIDLLKDLQHENIVQYLDSSSDGDYLNIFLEYVPGGSVTALLRNYGAFEEALVRNFVRQILQGLNYLHERDIIHRDIKGANILVDNKGGIKISDFGISKKVEDNLMPGSRVHRPSLQGSVFWMAPEVVKQTSYTRKADIWSVGCLVVEMLTGQHPFPQLTQMQAIFKIGSSAKPTIPSDISSDAEDFLQKAFEIDHDKRPTAAELLQHPWIVKDPVVAAANKKAP